jgi:hypothetical protein
MAKEHSGIKVKGLNRNIPNMLKNEIKKSK